jgi:hypothetical protein
MHPISASDGSRSDTQDIVKSGIRKHFMTRFGLLFVLRPALFPTD